MRPTPQPETRREKSLSNNKGFSLIELLVVVAIILIIAAIAIPNLLRARMAANEASAAETTRTFTTASVIYFTTWGDGYPPNIAVLGGTGGTATCDQSNLMDPVVINAPNQKSGFTFAFNTQGPPVSTTPGNCGAAGGTGYLVTATPITEYITGTRSFCADEAGTLHYDVHGTTPATEVACEAFPALQ
jgi:type IV pilus assembly protein PilA